LKYALLRLTILMRQIVRQALTQRKKHLRQYIAVPSFAMTDFVDNTGNSFNKVKNEVNPLHHIRQED
jgi:hypothetical protein